MEQVLVNGVDMEEIERVRRLEPRIRARFIERVLTPAERSHPQPPDEHIVGIFCAKEALAKALGCGIGEISWQEIQVLSDPRGKPVLHLTGRAADLAGEMGITGWAVSISHTRTHAIASVVGLGIR